MWPTLRGRWPPSNDFMNERLKGGIFSDEWKVREFKYQFRRRLDAEKPYEYTEYPKAVQVGDVTHTAHNAEEEAALNALQPEVKSE